MDYWSIQGDQLTKFDKATGPAPLFAFLETEVAPLIENLDISLVGVKDIINKSSFSMNVLNKLKDFYYPDWKVVGCYLYADDYSIQSIILSTRDEWNNEYRITVNAVCRDCAFQVEFVNFGNTGKNFTPANNYSKELKLVSDKYEAMLPPKPVVVEKPKPVMAPVVEDNRYFDFSYQGQYVFRSHMGPAELFRAVSMLVKSFEDKGLDYLSNSIGNDMNVVPLDIQQSILHFLKSKWLVEACVLNEYLSLENILLFNKTNDKYHLLINKYGKIIYIIDCEIEYGDVINETDDVYHKVNALFGIVSKKEIVPEVVRVVEKPVVVTTPTKVVPPLTIVSEKPVVKPVPVTKPKAPPVVKEENPYAEWYAIFKNKYILIIGASEVGSDNIRHICVNLGFNRNNIMIYNDYEKLPNKDFTFLKGQKAKYCGIVLGAVPHSVMGKGSYASISDMMAGEENYPFMVEANTVTNRKEPKITSTSLKSALNEIIRNEIRTNPLLN